MAGRYKQLKVCRVSGSRNLIPVLHLGEQELTGVFPRPGDEVTLGPLTLVWCPDSGLLQLGHTFDANEMYGENYGYRSGLNGGMVRHLTQKVLFLEKMADLKSGNVVLDIGSNDCTSLKAYTASGVKRIGIDPTGAKFRAYYPDDVTLVPDFFSAANFRKVSPRRATVVTSVAMFYDLDDPIGFARDIAQILEPDGIWHFEQSYMPAMLRTTSYDTICHEHLEYYSLGVVRKILDAADLQLIDVQMNGINGGSFAVTASPKPSKRHVNRPVIDWLLGQEERMGLGTVRPFREFEDRVFRHRADLVRLLHALAHDGKSVLGYGASTKGNVTLQFCGVTTKEVAAIAEINTEKFGRETPGTHIPIVSEAEAKAMKPDYFLVLPWHFKEGILQREQEYIAQGGKFIFPFPEIEII